MSNGQGIFHDKGLVNIGKYRSTYSKSDKIKYVFCLNHEISELKKSNKK